MQVKGKATLIRYTQNPEATVALAAKLCYSSREIDDLLENIEGADNSTFIARLSDMGHESPMEHASFTFAIEGVSRALLAQITRHRIASFSVRSQRYVSESDFAYIIPPSIEELGESEVEVYKNQMNQIAQFYLYWQDKLQSTGKGKESVNEDARFVLPNACETKMILTMNARELLHFFALRCCNRAQWEIREIAWQMLEQVMTVAPELFKNAGASCCKGNCTEGAKSCGKSAQVRERKKALSQKISEGAK